MNSKRVFISADHGLAVVYFLQTDVLPTLLKAGIEVVLLTDDGLKEQIIARFGQPGLSVEGLRLDKARQYFETKDHSMQYWMHFCAGWAARSRLTPRQWTATGARCRWDPRRARRCCCR